MNTLLDLTGRVAIVTGASSGLGAQCAIALATAGATVLAAARRADRLEKLEADIPGIVAVPGDVTCAGDREVLVARAIERSGRIDILVNNAGVNVESPAEDESLEDFLRVFDLNLHSAFALTQLVARPMLAAGSGSIINMGSMFGLVAASPVRQASYCASKGAMVNLTRELAVQWADRGVRVNTIAPGWFPTELTEELFSSERGLAYLRRNTPMRRAGRIHELDGIVLLLASDASSYLTGQTIAVDGGWTAR